MRILTNILERRAREWADHKSDYCYGLLGWQIPSIKIYYTLTELPSTRAIIRTQSVQSLSHVQLFVTPWIAGCQSSLCITNSRSLLTLMYIQSMMPSNHLILCHPFLLPSIFATIRVFCSKLALCVRCPKYWSFSISPSEYSGLIPLRIHWFDLLTVQRALTGPGEMRKEPCSTGAGKRAVSQ